MALDSYTNLLTAVGAELHRNDVTASLVADWVDLCEADFNRRLRVRQMETSTTGNTSAGGTLALPSDYLEATSLYIDVSSRRQTLRPVGLSEYGNLSGADDLGTPFGYVLTGTTISFVPAPDAAYKWYLYYFARIAALTSTANWVLENHPDIYFYGSLMHSAPYLKNDKRLVIWTALYEAGIKRVIEADEKARRGGGPMNVRIAGSVA